MNASPLPRYHSISLTNSNSSSKRSLHKQRPIKTQIEEYDILNSVSKKYIYFHEQRQKTPHDNKKLSFPYAPLNLCYFQNKFGGKKDITQKKKLNFNSNISIRNYLDLKLHTEPAESKKSDSEKQIYVGKKISEFKKKTQQPSKQEKMPKSIVKESNKISRNDEKYDNVNKFPLVLKIKSKKAYFQSRFKIKSPKNDQMNEANTVFLKKSQQQNANPFEMKFRSKTQDNINLIQLLNQQSRKGSLFKKNKSIFNTLKEQKVEAWEYQNNLMDSSLKFEDNL